MSAAPLIVLVHGIETAEPADSIGRVAARFEACGFKVAPLYRYGQQRLWEVRGSREEVGFGLLSTLRVAAQFHAGPVIPVGHSRGCLAIHDAALLQDKSLEAPAFTRAVYLSPALDADTDPAPQIESLHVHYTRSDRTVWWARWLAWHPFGDMGRRGYRGDDREVTNFDATGSVAGHSGWWLPKGLDYVSAAVIPALAAAVGHRIPSLGFLPQ